MRIKTMKFFISGWKDVSDEVYLFKKEREREIITRTPFPILHCLFSIGFRGRDVFS